MIISHDKQFAFFRNPKTGSTTAAFLLRLSGAFTSADFCAPINGMTETLPESAKSSLRAMIAAGGRVTGDLDQAVTGYSAHLTPQQAIDHGLITLEQLRAYDCYAFLREPMDRAISCYAHSFGRIAPPEHFKTVLDHVEARGDRGVLWRDQSDYFMVDGEQVVTSLPYEDFEAGIRLMLTRVGGFQFPEIPSMNKSMGRRLFTKQSYMTEPVLSALSPMVSRDVALYEGRR